MAEEADAKPSEPEVETQPEVQPAEEASPVEQVNDVTSPKVNGATHAAEASVEETSSQNDQSLSTSQEWVSVPRPEEATPVPEGTPVTSQSWADDHAETTTEVRSEILNPEWGSIF